MKTLGVIAFSLLAACGTTDEFELDEQAAAEGADGKADSVAGLTRLERATATQVTNYFVTTHGPELRDCFAAYQAKIDSSATKLTKEVANNFIDVAIIPDNRCSNWADLSDIVEGVLDMKSATELTIDEVVAAMPAWAKPQLVAASVSGYVEVKDLDLLFYMDVMRVRDKNAMAREKDPTGIDLAAIRDAWKDVRSGTTLDEAYLNPVTFAAGALDGDQIFKNLRAAFPLRSLSLTATGYNAISEFAAAGEGPDGDPAFSPIATALRKGSIKKRFYFAGGGEYAGNPWSSNVLIVVDEHGQAWGMQMGYSE